MFKYFGLSDTDTEYATEQMHFWDYVISLSEGFVKFGSLTENQYNSMLKHFDKRGFAYLPYGVARSNLYKAKKSSKVKRSAPRTEVLFNNLQCINTYDLPFESGDTVEVIIHKFNNSSVVLESNSRYYKIPKPAIYELGTISYLYHRTTYKGFLKLP